MKVANEASHLQHPFSMSNFPFPRSKTSFRKNHTWCSLWRGSLDTESGIMILGSLRRIFLSHNTNKKKLSYIDKNFKITDKTVEVFLFLID